MLDVQQSNASKIGYRELSNFDFFATLYAWSVFGGNCKVYCILSTALPRIQRMGWLWLVGSIKLYVTFAKEPYKRDHILQKRPILFSILLTVPTPYRELSNFEFFATLYAWSVFGGNSDVCSMFGTAIRGYLVQQCLKCSVQAVV